MAKHRNESTIMPDERDFDPYGGCLDAQHAWVQFGGLSIEQAYSKFKERPCFHQEDFMFMGGKAFAYYFPVLDRYLREFRAADGTGEDDDSDAAIIGAGFSAQLLSPTSSELRGILDRISDLARYVRDNSYRLAVDPDERKRIDTEWQEVQSQLPNDGRPEP